MLRELLKTHLISLQFVGDQLCARECVIDRSLKSHSHNYSSLCALVVAAAAVGFFACNYYDNLVIN